MPSSTSSSDRRRPTSPYARQWALTALLLVCSLSLAEWALRRHGYYPGVTDSRELWCFHRDRVYSRGRRPRLVVVGSSRAQLGIDPVALEAALPDYTVVHLALDGTPVSEVVRDLCEDDGFDGVILWSAIPSLLPLDDASRKRPDSRQVDYYWRVYRQDGARRASLKRIAREWLQAHLASFVPGFSLRHIAVGLPAPMYAQMRFDRFRPARYRAAMSSERLAEHREIRMSRRRAKSHDLSEPRMRQVLDSDLPLMNSRLTKHGGSMVLVRMPTDGEYWELDARDAPKRAVWDHIEPATGIPTIHFKDYPELRVFDCPDGSHLDASDAPEFTRRLAQRVQQALAEQKRVP